MARHRQEFYLSVCIRTTEVCGISEYNTVLVFNKRNVVSFSNLLEVFYYIKLYYWARTSLLTDRTKMFCQYILCSTTMKALSVGQMPCPVCACWLFPYTWKGITNISEAALTAWSCCLLPFPTPNPGIWLKMLCSPRG